MKKQFTKIKQAAENLSWSNKADCGDSELELIDKHVEHYRDSIDKISRKLPAAGSGSSGASSNSSVEQRIKKNAHQKLGLTFEECSREIANEMPQMQYVLTECAELEKSIADHIVRSEQQTESRVVACLRHILDKYSPEIATAKRNVTKTAQEAASCKNKYENALRGSEVDEKITNLRTLADEWGHKLQKERDVWAGHMYEFIAEEENVVASLRDYVENQKVYHEQSLKAVNNSLMRIDSYLQTRQKMRFGTPLEVHLASTGRKIAYVIELCVCALYTHGISTEGLLRVNCHMQKLRRMICGLNSQRLQLPLPKYYYQDAHLIACVLKQYLRDLPEPLFTFKAFNELQNIGKLTSQEERKVALKKVLSELPEANYENLRYLLHFLRLVARRQDENRMNAHNLAIVIGPNVISPPKNLSSDYQSELSNSSGSQMVIAILIEDWDYFFKGEVELFVTFERNNLLEKSDDHATESYTRRDPEVSESPRYSTIRRNKASAPSPPVKVNSNGDVEVNGIKVRPQAKELFIENQKPIAEKPEKPPVPKFPGHNISTHPGGKQEEPDKEQQQQLPPPLPPSLPSLPTVLAQAPSAAETPNRPQPMTRTQFFNFDLPSTPAGDRRSIMQSSFSITPKPNVPMKPKVTPRPNTLGLSNSFRKISDEQITPPLGSADSLSASSTEKLDEKQTQQEQQMQCAKKADSNETDSEIEATMADIIRPSASVTTPNSPLNFAGNRVRRSYKSYTTPSTIKRPTEPAPPPPPTIIKKQID